MVVLFTACLPKYSKILGINTAVNDFALQNYTKKMTLANKSAIFHVFRSFYQGTRVHTYARSLYFVGSYRASLPSMV